MAKKDYNRIEVHRFRCILLHEKNVFLLQVTKYSVKNSYRVHSSSGPTSYSSRVFPERRAHAFACQF